jgi:hypothetical protein
LNNVGFNPKINISSKFVIKVDIIEIFDLNCESLKTMNPHLNLTPRKTCEVLLASVWHNNELFV